MIQALALSLVIAMGYVSGEARSIAHVAAHACEGEPDAEACLYDSLVYARNESGMVIHPRPFSHDAKLGLSRGPWQVQGAGFRIEDQAARWVALRRWSLQQCGSLAALASGRCDRGTHLAAARAAEVEDWRFAMQYAEAAPELHRR